MQLQQRCAGLGSAGLSSAGLSVDGLGNLGLSGVGLSVSTCKDSNDLLHSCAHESHQHPSSLLQPRP